jgi:S1-C subfamily serine protease
MKQKRLLLPILVLALSILACGKSTNGLSNKPSNIIPTAIVRPTNVPLVLSDQLLSQQEAQVAIYQHVSPGVVAIVTDSDQGESLGSGIVYDTNGYIITNFHVVEGATAMEVDFPSGYKTTAKVVGTDTDSDIAVIKVEAADGQLVPVALGDSNQIQVGQTVLAIGNPYGLNSTMTIGIVSALGRTLSSMHQSQTGTTYTAGDLIQTDAAINPGNSGGPLLNLNGEVIGINRAIQTNGTSLTGDAGNIGIGFAIASNIVKRVVPELIANGKYDYPYLGLTSTSNLSLADQETLGLSQSIGAYVVKVEPGGPAARAGIIAGSVETKVQGLNKGGDLIIAIDGQNILTFGDLLKYLINNKVPGDTVTLTVLRDGLEKEIDLKLGSRP